MPARAWSLIAVMRICTGPDVLFHCMPATVARPSGPVVTTSVRSPELNTPPEPLLRQPETHGCMFHWFAAFVSDQYG